MELELDLIQNQLLKENKTQITPFCFEGIEECIIELTCGKPAGIENIFLEFLKNAADPLLNALNELKCH